MRYDFHTHRIPDDPEVTALVSAAARPTGASPRVFWSLEAHPWTPELPADWAATAATTDAIGEAGLDRRRGVDPAEQKRRWRAALAAALEYGKPLVLHAVHADDELAADLLAAPGVRILRHGWNTPKPEALAAALARGWWIGLNRRTPDAAFAYFRSHPEFRNRLALESDDESDAVLPALYRRAAELLGWTERKLTEILHDNFDCFVKGCNPR